MPVTLVPLNDADREKMIWRVGGSLLAMRLTIFTLVTALLVALYCSMQMYDLHIGFRLTTAFMLGAAALAASVYYKMFANRMKKDQDSDQKKVVIGMIVGGVPSRDEMDDTENVRGRIIVLDIGRQTIPIRASEILIVDKKMYRARQDLRQGDMIRAEFSQYGDLLLSFGHMEESDYDLFDEDAFSDEDVQDIDAEIGAGA